MDFINGTMNINLVWNSDEDVMMDTIKNVTNDQDFNIASETIGYSISISKIEDKFSVEIFINDFILEIKYEENWTPELKTKVLELLNKSLEDIKEDSDEDEDENNDNDD